MQKGQMRAIVIHFLVIAVLQCMVTPLQPKLSSRRTKDLKFHCDMEGFNAPLSSLLSLQIAKRAQNTNGEDVILATVDSGEAWLSYYVTERDEHRHYVSGRLDLSQKRNAWLELRITDITPQEYGLYSCHIHYTDHPADTKHSTWTKEFLVDETVSEASGSGFRIRFSKGVHIECDSGVLDETDGHVTQMKISAVKSERHWFASWCEDTNTSTCSPELLGPYHRGQRRSANEGILEVHIPDATCHHQSKHVCAVTTSSGKNMEFVSERLPLEECQQRLEAKPSAADNTTTASTPVVGLTTEVKEAVEVIWYVLPVIFVVALISISLVLFLYLRRKRKSTPAKFHDKNASGRSDPDEEYPPSEKVGKEGSTCTTNSDKTDDNSRNKLLEEKLKATDVLDQKESSPYGKKGKENCVCLINSDKTDESTQPLIDRSRKKSQQDVETASDLPNTSGEGDNSQNKLLEEKLNVTVKVRPPNTFSFNNETEKITCNIDRGYCDEDTTHKLQETSQMMFSSPIQESNGSNARSKMVC